MKKNNKKKRLKS